MFSEDDKKPWRKLGGRLLILYGCIFLISSAILFASVYYLMSNALLKKDHQMIQSKFQELGLIYKQEGLDGLTRSTSREYREEDLPFLVRISNADGKTIFYHNPESQVDFDRATLEKPVSESDASQGVWRRLEDKSDEDVIEYFSKGIPGGLILQVGRSNAEREQTLEMLSTVFIAVTSLVIAVGCLGGWILANRTLRPIRDLIQTLKVINEGDAKARVPSGTSGDELDVLTRLFNQMLEKIETLVQGMKNTVDNVAHDLRTPITHFRSKAELALQSPDDKDLAREALLELLESSEQILALVDTVTGISEAEAGSMRLRLESGNPRVLIEQIRSLYEIVAEEAEVSIHVASECSSETVLDPNQIKRALANLIDNAIKYNRKGGSVWVRAEETESALRLSVRDDGIGISKENLPYVGTRLYRCDPSRSRKGLGLGVSLVKAIALAHGGILIAESELERGSCFTLVIPKLPNN